MSSLNHSMIKQAHVNFDLTFHMLQHPSSEVTVEQFQINYDIYKRLVTRENKIKIVRSIDSSEK